MPSFQAREPGLDGMPRLCTFVSADEGAEEDIRGWHPVCLGNGPFIAKLCETEKACTVVGL